MGCNILYTPFIFVSLRGLRCDASGWVSCIVLQTAPLHSHFVGFVLVFSYAKQTHIETEFAYGDIYVSNFL